MRVLVTGATGYIGGRLIPILLAAGHQVRCLTRNPERLDGHPRRGEIEVAKGDVLDPESLDEAMAGCEAAYYLVHSMEAGDHDFRERDRLAARNFRDAAAKGSIDRIVYLGGLGRGDGLSRHLLSRQEVGSILADGPTPVTELRAAVIIGSGSVSFEMLRYLTEVLPVMVTPKWVRTRCQPIAVADVLEILDKAISEPGGKTHVYEIGGPEQLSYEEMMRVYAEAAGLPRRWIIPVPVLSPWLSSHWVGLVTPLPTGVAKPLVESLGVEVVVSDNSYARDLAGPLTGYREAVTRALKRSIDLEVDTRWSDASPGAAQAFPSDPDWAGGTVLSDRQEVSSRAGPETLFWAFSRIGGEVGYYAMNWAWGFRGLVDTLIGGVGLRRGRRHPENLRPGDALDFWRVVSVEAGRAIQLFAEMRLPGEAWLAFEAIPDPGGSILKQTALFVPRGLLGRLYWWVMSPFHLLIFGRMAKRIARAAEASESSPEIRHSDSTTRILPGRSGAHADD
jgi:uncharacterized protein YbjT (DUF2867 family)